MFPENNQTNTDKWQIMQQVITGSASSLADLLWDGNTLRWGASSLSAVWWTPGNYGNRRTWFWHCFLDARAVWTCSERVKIKKREERERENVWGSVSKREVKTGNKRKETIMVIFCSSGLLCPAAPSSGESEDKGSRALSLPAEFWCSHSVCQPTQPRALLVLPTPLSPWQLHQPVLYL